MMDALLLAVVCGTVALALGAWVAAVVGFLRRWKQ
jgi:hypothetical protein